MSFPTEHVYQFGPNFPANGCGPSDNTILANLYFPGRRYTMPQMASLVGNSGGFSTFNGMMTALTRVGLPSMYHPKATIDWLDYMLARSYPVIMLVDYASFDYRPFGYWLAHFVLVVDIDDKHVTAHDSLRVTGPTKFTRVEFQRAIDTPSRFPRADGSYGLNYANQAIYPLQPYSTLHRLMRQFRENLSGVIQ